MKEYLKPTMEISIFRANEKIAASIFGYTENGFMPVTLVEVQADSWNLGSGESF